MIYSLYLARMVVGSCIFCPDISLSGLAYMVASLYRSDKREQEQLSRVNIREKSRMRRSKGAYKSIVSV